jgi:hypothetical protein
MGHYECGYQRNQKWYNKRIFPLIPTIESKPADEYNTSSYCFRWLIFTFWTIDTPQFELSIVIDSHWGIGIIGLLPYVRWVIAVPIPKVISHYVYRNFSRKPNSND